MNASEIAENVSAYVERFNTLAGRLRISVTHACQLKCKFCHQEGIQNHWQPIHIDVPFYSALVEAFAALGGKEINLTGGDALVHPQINELIDIAFGKVEKVAVCTNGLLLHRILDRVSKVDEIKVSLHSFLSGDQSDLLGKAWKPQQVINNIKSALNVGANITLNFTLTAANIAELNDLVQFAYDHKTNILLIDLIDTRWQRASEALGKQSYARGIAALSAFAKEIEPISDRTGSVMRVFDPGNGRKWMIKDERFGVLFTEMCNGCTKQQQCGEGVFVLRVDAEGVFRPCLLRPDLEEKMRPSGDTGAAKVQLGRMLERMMK